MPKPVTRKPAKPAKLDHKQPEMWNLPTRLLRVPPGTPLDEFFSFVPTMCFGCRMERYPEELRVNLNKDFICINEKRCKADRNA